MTRSLAPVAILACAMSFTGAAADADAPARADGSLRGSRTPSPRAKALSVPSSIEENLGQVPADVDFVARVAGREVHLSGDGARFVLPGGDGVGCAVTMRFEGASAGAAAVGAQPLKGRSNYFLGNDPARWVRNARHFGRVRVPDLYPGVHLSWLPAASGIRYDFEVAPGASPDGIRIAFDGARGARLDAQGRLVVESTGGTLRHSKPVAWQETGGLRRRVRARFVERPGGFGIEVAAWHRSRPLVIDPTVEYATLLGGGNVAVARGSAIDSQGDIYLAGDTSATSFPTKNAYQTSFQGDAIFVTKLGGDDYAIEYSTFIGSPEQEITQGLAVSPDGEALVTASSSDIFGNFPIVNAAQEDSGGEIDTVVARLATTGSSLVYSTYLGGSNFDFPRGIALDSDGAAWVAGWTISTNFPLVDEIRDTSTLEEGFLTKVSPDGSAFEFSSYIGGSGGDHCTGVAVDADGVIWFCGLTNSNGLATSGAFQTSRGGSVDGYLAAIRSPDYELEYLTYLGGGAEDVARGVAVSPAGSVCVVGETASSDFPTSGALQASYGGGARDGFLVSVDGESRSREYATYLGGSDEDAALGVALTPDGEVLVTGFTKSSGFPTASPSQAAIGGVEDFFLTQVKPDGSALLYSSFWGATAQDIGLTVATDGSLVLAAGQTRGLDFPEVNGRNETSLGQIAVGILAVRIGPKPLRNLRVIGEDDDGVHLEWTDPHSGAYDVEVERRVEGGEFEVVGTEDSGGTTFVDGSVIEDTEYIYRVRGVSAGGNTPYSLTVVVGTAFKGPSGLAASAPENDLVALSWEDNSGVETKYEVLRRVPPSATLVPIEDLNTGSESFEDETAEPETTYVYVVRGHAPSGATADTGEASATTGPKDPSGLVATAVHDGRIDVAWVDESLAEESYELERRIVGGGASFSLLATLPVDSNSFVDKPVAGETTYEYRVRCLNSNGVSEYSAPGSERTPPPSPSGLAATALLPTTIRVTWADNSEFEEAFRLERSVVGSGVYTVVVTTAANVTSHDDTSVKQETSYVYRVRALNADGFSRDADGEAVETPAELFLAKAARLPAKGARPAQLTITGSFDPGARAVVLAGPATVRISGAPFAIPGFTSLKAGKLLRYEDESIRVELKPSKTGGSVVAFKVIVSGPVAEAVEPSGPLAVEFSFGSYLATGQAVLEGGKLDPARGLGSRVHPLVHLTGFKATLIENRPQKLTLSAAFPASESAPAAAPAVSFSVGSSPVYSFAPSEFTAARNGKFTLRRTGMPAWTITLDSLRGTLKVKGADVDIGDYGEGLVPVRITIAVGTDRIEDVPVFVRSSTTLTP